MSLSEMTLFFRVDWMNIPISRQSITPSNYILAFPCNDWPGIRMDHDELKSSQV